MSIIRIEIYVLSKNLAVIEEIRQTKKYKREKEKRGVDQGKAKEREEKEGQTEIH